MSDTEAPLPEEVTSLLGSDPVELTGEGTGRVFTGSGYVAKLAPDEIIRRESRILTDLRGQLPLRLPEVVATGSGWLVTEYVQDSGEAWQPGELEAILDDLARLHMAFQGSAALGGDWLAPWLPYAHRIEENRRADPSHLPDVVREALRNPEPLLSRLDGREPTLLHGDPWTENVRRSADGARVWIDWANASAGPAAADVATWIEEASWHLDREIDPPEAVGRYLAARPDREDQEGFREEVDVALVLRFLTFRLADFATEGREDSEREWGIVRWRAQILRRLEDV